MPCRRPVAVAVAVRRGTRFSSWHGLRHALYNVRKRPPVAAERAARGPPALSVCWRCLGGHDEPAEAGQQTLGLLLALLLLSLLLFPPRVRAVPESVVCSRGEVHKTKFRPSRQYHASGHMALWSKKTDGRWVVRSGGQSGGAASGKSVGWSCGAGNVGGGGGGQGQELPRQ